MSRAYLDPKQPLHIEPAADRNVERITDCCLDASSKMSHFLGKGRGGGAWWMIWLIFFTYALCFFSLLYVLYTVHFNIASALFLNGLYEAVFYVIVPCTIGFGLSLLFPIHVWKTHYPIRFSRKTRKVYCHFNNKIYIEDWDTIRVYLQTKLDFNAMGAPSQTPQINIEFHNEDGSVAENSVIGVDKGGLHYDEQAAAFWEYIRRFMEEGPQDLPLPEMLKTDKPAANLGELHKLYLNFRLWAQGASFFTKMLNILFLPLFIVWTMIAYPTEILYYYLDKHVIMKPFPPEMDEPCRCENEVVIWEPKQHREKQHEEAA
jgi:hypothetical protein